MIFLNKMKKSPIFNRFNIIFWVLGFLLLGIGAWSRLEKNNLYSQLSLFYLDPAWILVIVGTIIWCIGFSGKIIIPESIGSG
jgi:tetraspanin-5